MLVSGEEIDLTASEFKLLTTLSRYPGSRVHARMELVEKVLGYDFEG
ncbi:MAG: winged helix-turn-helix domain-containing protein [Adlercreutzia equolifaciens]